MIGIFKNVFSFNERIDRKIQFWTILGPVFLILSLSLADTPLLLITLFSLLLCFKYGSKGLSFSLFVLLVFSSYNHLIALSERHLWNLGLESSIALGLVITSFSFDYISSFIESFKGTFRDNIKELEEKLTIKESKNKQLIDELQVNIEHLKNDIEEKRDEMAALHSLNDTLKRSSEDNLKGKEALSFEIVQKERRIEEVETELDEIQEKIALLKDEEFLKDKNLELSQLLQTAKIETDQEKFKNEDLLKQLSFERQKREALENNQNPDQSLIIQNLNNEIALANDKIIELQNNSQTTVNSEELEQMKLKLKDKNSLLMSYEKKFTELNKVNGLLLQLKDQFNEKNQVLHQTRSELFHVREELIAIKRDLKNDYEDLSENEKLLMQDLHKSEADIVFVEEENDNLKSIISSLTEKMKKPSTKKDNKKKEADPEMIN